MTPICFVFGAGPSPVCPPKIAAQDMVIAADGGYLYTQSAGIRADAVVGDFDSLGGTPEHGIDGPFVMRLPKEKDQTDTFAALKYGLERGFSCFHIYGGVGGRLDHTLANIQCLTFLLNHGARGYLHDEDTVTTALRGEVWLSPRESGVIAIFALGGPAEGVCLRGLKYELEDTTLTPDYPLGVSNEFIGQSVYVGVERGDLLIIYPTGTQEFIDL
jgi:thiamine pyrophosphokinase